jgi:hypothetical protein
MGPRRFHSAPPRRLAWLLWLALLLPLAQSAVAWHAVSHSATDASAHDGKQVLHAVPCDLCLAAAALGGGALPTAPQGLVHPAAPHRPPHAAPACPWLPPPVRAYHSRAPPVAPH